MWIDLSKEGLDEKIILRKDGTAVYMTQDIGTILFKDTMILIFKYGLHCW